MRRIRLALVCVLAAASLGLAAGGDAAVLPANRWVPMNEPPSGVQMLGWDELDYAPDLGGVLFLGAYRGYTSENQNAFWLYRFKENRWHLLHVNLFWHRSELAADGGHTAGRMTYDERRKVLVYGGPVSMSPNDRLRTWIFDPRAQAGWDARPAAPVPNTPFDAASVYVPELGGTLRHLPGAGTWLYDAVDNRWTQLVKPGGGPTLDCAEAVYDPARRRVLVFGGSSGHYSGRDFTVGEDLWSFDVANKTWTKLEAKDPPPGRGWPQMALSPAADVVIMAGGSTGKRSAQAGLLRHADTWVLDLKTLEWRELKDAGFPGAGWSNHMAYDAANGVFLHLGPRRQNYGYSCGMYALRYDGHAAAAQAPDAVPAPGYDLAALPKPAGSWAALEKGALADAEGWCFWPALASNGKDLLLAFGEYPPWPGPKPDPAFYVRACRLTDGAWTDLAGGEIHRGHPWFSQTPAVAFDGAGRPIMVCEGYRIWQKLGLTTVRFEDGAWKTAAEALVGGFLPALSGGPRPAAAWQHYTSSGRGAGVTVGELTDAGWQTLGKGPLNAGDPAVTRARFPALVRDSEGRHVVAWQEHTPDWSGKNATPERIHVRRFEKGAWMALGDAVPAGAPDTRAVSFAMALHGDAPVVAACEGTDGGRARLVVRLWTAGAWQELGPGPLNLLGDASGALRPALASDGRNLYVAWPEFLPGRPPLLFVKRWDGRAWALVGGPLNAAPGTGSVHRPVLTILDGKPVVAWTEFVLDDGPYRRVHVRRME